MDEKRKTKGRKMERKKVLEIRVVIKDNRNYGRKWERKKNGKIESKKGERRTNNDKAKKKKKRRKKNRETEKKIMK